jgi:uncharacterized membrane protein
MTAAENAAPAPPRRFPWLKALLVVSLALNLLFIGGAVARFATHGPPERMSGVSQMQLIPRKFIGELDRDRRRELMLVFKDFAKRFRDGRREARDEVVTLAAALEAEPYDPARVKAIVDAFSAKSATLAGSGGEAALTLISKLTPGERKLLAKHIRLRDEGGKRRDGGKPEDD